MNSSFKVLKIDLPVSERKKQAKIEALEALKVGECFTDKTTRALFYTRARQLRKKFKGQDYKVAQLPSGDWGLWRVK